jgi:hypothetical protein
LGVPIRGTAAEIADTFRVFAGMGVTRLEVLLWPDIGPIVEAMAPVLAALDG